MGCAGCVGEPPRELEHFGDLSRAVASSTWVPYRELQKSLVIGPWCWEERPR